MKVCNSLRSSAKYSLEHQAVGLLHNGEVQGKIADEALDHLTADQIVPIEGAPLPLGMAQ